MTGKWQAKALRLNRENVKRRELISDNVEYELAPIAEEILAITSKQSEAVVEIGKRLNAVKERLKREGVFLDWTKRKLPDLSPSTIANYSRAAYLCEQYQFVNFTNLTPSSLYDLARHVRSDPVNAIMAKAQGQRISHKEVRAALKTLPKPPRVPRERSGKTLLTRKQLQDLASEISTHLSKMPHYDLLLQVVKERGVKFVLSTHKDSIPLVDVDGVLAPFDPEYSLDHWRQPPLT